MPRPEPARPQPRRVRGVSKRHHPGALWGAISVLGPVICANRRWRPSGMMITCVSASAVPDLRPGRRLDGPAGPRSQAGSASPGKPLSSASEVILCREVDTGLLIHLRPGPVTGGRPGRVRAGRGRWQTPVNRGQHCWKACCCSNPFSPRPRTPLLPILIGWRSAAHAHRWPVRKRGLRSSLVDLRPGLSLLADESGIADDEQVTSA
jgi:hypothetical protein